MKPPAKNSKPLLGLFLLAGLSGLSLAAESTALPAGKPQQLTSPDQVPTGLEKSDWHSIRAAYEAGRHAVHRQEDGTFSARNPGQQWRTDFDGKGFLTTPDHGQWTWGLELTGYGERAVLSASSSITHEGGKITCQRDENLTEWFINDTRGLEQGWTIQSKPTPTTETLTLNLALRGDLKAQVSPDSSSVAFQTSSGGTALTYSGLKAWDADGTNLIVRFEPAGENAIRIAVEDQNARYPITIDPIAQQAFLKASNTESNDYFGESVAVSGDTVVIGAHFEDSSTTGVNSTPNESASNSGAAYVFTRSGATWIQQAYLKASNTGAGDYFGISVAVSGDTVVIGASGEASSTTGVNTTPNNSAVDSGAAYVFTRSGTTWSQQAYLKASNTGASDEFGITVAVSADTVVVGASWEDSTTTGVNSTPNESASNSGAAYVFTRSGATWSQQAYLKASNTAAGDFFGSSVAVSGNTVVVGAPYEDSSTTGVNSMPNESAVDSGAAYVFTRSGTTWSQQAYLKASNTGAGDSFGQSVAVSGDTVVVGALTEDSSTTGVNSTPNESASSAGAAYVLTRSGTTWSQQAYLKASNTGNNDLFGYSVAVSGDTVVIGARREGSSTTGVNSTPNESAQSSGAAYVFTRSGTSWSQQAYLKASNTGVGDGFAYSVGVSGDTVVVGANGESSSTTGVNSTPNENAFGSGAAYIFSGLGPVIEPSEIVIKLAGTDIAANSTQALGPLVVGTSSDLIFSVLNTGNSDLTLTGTPKAALTGSGDFTVTAQPASIITGPSGGTTFTVRFSPTSPGVKTAAVSIPNNDPDENPFVINLTGSGTSTFTFNYLTGAEQPITSNGYTATGTSLNLSLGYRPAVGTGLTVVSNTGSNFIGGTFINLAQGQEIALSFGGSVYKFVANYYGGSGNDLVLMWAGTRPLAWGANYVGQLGNGDLNGDNVLVPSGVNTTGILAGKTVTSMSAGGLFSLALCSDGTIASWGRNGDGELGDGTFSNEAPFAKFLPVAVDRTGVLAGKTVIAVSAGYGHAIGLASDGTVSAWGSNGAGSLGRSDITNSASPVAIDPGVLAGKTVVSISSGESHNLVRCSDGTLASWGYNLFGQCGDGTFSSDFPYSKSLPVAVNRSGVLSGKTITAISAGGSHSLVLCSDSTLVAWGNNEYGMLGNNSTTNSAVPVRVSRTGVLSGKTITSISAGSGHNLALCSDGTLAAWGDNRSGQLGNGTFTQSNIPVLVDRSGVLSGKTISGIWASTSASYAVCNDGTMVAWGTGGWGIGGVGSLGTGDLITYTTPVIVNTSMLAPEERFLSTASGSALGHALGIIASPVPTLLPEIGIERSGAAVESNAISPFGNVVVGTTSDVTFTVKNSGVGDLTLIGTPKVAVSGSPDFTVTSQPASPITGPSGSTTFSVRFAPSSIGSKNAVLSIPNNDANENPFTINLSGSGVTALTAFNNTISANSSLTGSNALPAAVPFGDGVKNLLKYAFNMNLSGPDSRALVSGTGTSGHPTIGLTGTGPTRMLRVEYLRRKGSGLIYTPKRSSTLSPGSFVAMTGTPVVTSIDANWERVVVQESANPSTLPKSFAIVEVSLP